MDADQELLIQLSREKISEKKEEFEKLLQSRDETETVEKLLMLAGDLKKEMSHRKIDPEDSKQLRKRREQYCLENDIDLKQYEKEMGTGNFFKKKAPAKK